MGTPGGKEIPRASHTRINKTPDLGSVVVVDDDDCVLKDAVTSGVGVAGVSLFSVF